MTFAATMMCIANLMVGAPDVAECKGALEPSVVGGCQGVPSLGCCDVPGRNLWCQGGDLYCLDCTDGFQACGWNPQGYYDCGQTAGAVDPTGTNSIGCDGCDAACASDNACSSTCAGSCGACANAGEVCLEDGSCYAPQCGDKQCGTDAAGFSCGTCPDGSTCVEGIFQCLPAPTGCSPNTSTGGCEGCACEACVCETYPTCCTGKWDAFCASVCSDSCGMDCSPCPAEPSCDGLGCGSYCGVDCGECAGGEVCTDFQCCAPDCDQKTCGSDGCGGTCGECAGFDQCVSGNCEACVPDCTDKACGDDGCGGTCGECTGGEVCAQGVCATGFCAGQCGSDEPQDCGPGCTCFCNEQCATFGDCCDNVCDSCETLGQCCVPDCTGKACGDDGCGGSCGQCDTGDICEDGACVLCVADCTGKDCGGDGCGGTCGGDCPFGEGCFDGLCQGCADGLGWTGCCEDGVNRWCQNGVPQEQVCSDGCGWDFAASFYNCGFEIAEPTGVHPYSCSGECTPQCDGKSCGGDNCGGLCGTCPDTHSCVQGACVEGDCGDISSQGCCTNDSVLFCEEGVFQGYPCLNNSTCGWDATNERYNCGFTGDEPTGTHPRLCCAPQCDGKVCGDDGCGGSCGACASDEQCDAQGQCAAACLPNWCDDKACGTDTCGGSCGECAAGWDCKPDQSCKPTSACVPQCDVKQCGDDGCGKVCGECDQGFQCGATGMCEVWECTPDCSGKTCGTDGCWGQCGVCEQGQLCSLNACGPAGLCAALPASGRCDGQVAVTCKTNFIENLDCTKYNQVCSMASGKAKCVTPVRPPEPVPEGADSGGGDDGGGGGSDEGCASGDGSGPPVEWLVVGILAWVWRTRRRDMSVAEPGVAG